MRPARRRPPPAATLLVGLLGLMTAGAAAGAADFAKPNRVVLDNGLVLLFRPNPSALTLAVACFIQATARVETRETAGLRNLAQQALLEVTDASGQSLERRAAQRGIQITPQITADYLEMLFSATGDQFGETLGHVRELFTASTVDPGRLSVRRLQALRQVSARRELAQVVALDLATSHLYRGSPCSWPPAGTTMVGGIRVEQVQAFWRQRVAPNNAVVAVSGPLTWEQCQSEARRTLGSLLPRAPTREPAVPVTATQGREFVFQPWSGDNAVVLLASASPGPDAAGFPAAAVLSAVLAGGEGSRMFAALRVDRGWTYSVAAELVPSRLCGLMAVIASCAPEATGDVSLAMREEAAKLQAGPPTEAEVERAKAYLTSNYVVGHQRNTEVAHYLGLFQVLTPADPGTNLPQLLAGVTAAQVMQAAGWLAKRSVWVQVGGKRPDR